MDSFPVTEQLTWLGMTEERSVTARTYLEGAANILPARDVL
jgi:hypothetical protein